VLRCRSTSHSPLRPTLMRTSVTRRAPDSGAATKTQMVYSDSISKRNRHGMSQCPCPQVRRRRTQYPTEKRAQLGNTSGAPRFSSRVEINQSVATTTGMQAREGKIYCCCVVGTFSRRIVGWSIDTIQNSNLVVNALDMAIKNRQPKPGGVVHAGHGAQFTSWAFTHRIRKAGLMPSFGSVGDGLDNAMMESFWSSMQIGLLNRKK